MKSSEQPANPAVVPEPTETALQNTVSRIQEIRDIATSQLRVGLRPGKTQTDMLRRVNDALDKSLNKANELVGMIDHFRKATGRLIEPLSHTTVSLHHTVDRVLRGMQYTFPLNRITVLKIIPKEQYQLLVPPEHMETILFHLLNFARSEIGEDPGIITIESSERNPQNGDDALKHYQTFNISYISRNSLTQNFESIFDPFVQADELDQSGRFGVFVAKKLIEHHHGTIAVKASLHHVAFTIEFPSQGRLAA